MGESTHIEIDFTGEELIQIGQACLRTGETFNEFLDRAIRELVDRFKNDQPVDVTATNKECTCRFDMECICGVEQ